MNRTALSLLLALTALAPSAPARAQEPLPYGATCGFSEMLARSEYHDKRLEAFFKRLSPEIAGPCQLGLEFDRRLRAQPQPGSEELIIHEMQREALGKPAGNGVFSEIHLAKLDGPRPTAVACSYRGGAGQPREVATCLSVDLNAPGGRAELWKSAAERASWAPGKPMTEDEYVQSKVAPECRRGTTTYVPLQDTGEDDAQKPIGTAGQGPATDVPGLGGIGMSPIL